MNNLIDALQWRYATKKFDANKKVANEDIETLMQAMQLSASSYGLQPYSIFIISDPEVKKNLLAAAWGQQQVVDASHLIVIANRTHVDANLVHSYMDSISEIRKTDRASLERMATFMKGKLVELSDEAQNQWTAKQTYIALGNLLVAAASLKIDACPMEGFDAGQFNEILGLTDKNLNASVIVPIGYRSEEDDTQHYAKVRRPMNELFETI